MSAWIVSRDHIDALVCGAIHYGVPFDGEPVTPQNATAVGQKLWNANYRSIRCRYGDRNMAPRYTFVGETLLNPVNLFKQVGCFDYQTCECDDYERSAVYRFCEAMLDRLAKEIGVSRPQVYDLPAWNAAPWGL